MSLPPDYIKRLESELKELRNHLKFWEDNNMRSGSRTLGGEWKDTTTEDVERLKRTVATYEEILDRQKDA